MAYNSLLVQRRKELHRAAGYAIEELFPDRLAEHYGEPAIEHNEQALDIAQELDDRPLQAACLSNRFFIRSADSVRLAETIQTPREVWIGKASLGKLLARMGRDKEAEAQLLQAAQTIEAIAQKLQTPNLLQSFLGAEPVLEVYRALGRRPPQATL